MCINSMDYIPPQTLIKRKQATRLKLFIFRFYRDWVEALMSEGSRADVDAVIELAKENEATPMKMLEKTIGSLAEGNM